MMYRQTWQPGTSGGLLGAYGDGSRPFPPLSSALLPFVGGDACGMDQALAVYLGSPGAGGARAAFQGRWLAADPGFDLGALGLEGLTMGQPGPPVAVGDPTRYLLGTPGGDRRGGVSYAFAGSEPEAPGRSLPAASEHSSGVLRNEKAAASPQLPSLETPGWLRRGRSSSEPAEPGVDLPCRRRRRTCAAATLMGAAGGSWSSMRWGKEGM